MTDVIKVLGQSAPAATTATTLYTVPDRYVATTSSLVICNKAASAGTFRVAVRVNGEALANKQYLYYDMSLAANSTEAKVLGLTLNQGDIVTVYASSADFSFNLFGVETQ